MRRSKRWLRGQRAREGRAPRRVSAKRKRLCASVFSYMRHALLLQCVHARALPVPGIQNDRVLPEGSWQMADALPANQNARLHYRRRCLLVVASHVRRAGTVSRCA